MKKTHKKVGLVLGGGGAKAFAHLGIADVLKENNIPISMIVSCSGGSIIGALLANNISSKTIKRIFYSLSKRSNWFLPKFSRKGLLSQKNIKNILIDTCGNIDISKCKIPFYTVATNLNSGKLHVFNKGNLAAAVSASAAFPGVYAPVEINNQLFVDGGILNSIPSDVCRKKIGNNEFVITVNLDDIMKQEVNKYNMFGVTYRSIYLSLFHKRKHIMESYSDIILDVFEDSEFSFKNWRNVLSFYSAKKMEHFYVLGRQKAEEKLESIKRNIKL